METELKNDITTIGQLSEEEKLIYIEFDTLKDTFTSMLKKINKKKSSLWKTIYKRTGIDEKLEYELKVIDGTVYILAITNKTEKIARDIENAIDDLLS